MEKLTRKIRSFFLFNIGPILRIAIKKELPKGEKTLIHLGCGDLNDQRFINVDSRPGWHIDYVESAENLDNIFSPDFADLIYACHVLEHVSHQNTLEVLKKLRNILKQGGVLRLSVPDFKSLLRIYKEQGSVQSIINPLMGGQGYKENFHYSVFDQDYLKSLLKQAGFSRVESWNPENAPYHNFKDWSSRKYQVNGKEYDISLNLEAIK